MDIVHVNYNRRYWISACLSCTYIIFCIYVFFAQQDGVLYTPVTELDRAWVAEMEGDHFHKQWGYPQREVVPWKVDPAENKFQLKEQETFRYAKLRNN